MTNTVERQSVDFDHHTAEHAQRWQARYAELRRTCPVAYSEHHDGFWVITRYDDVFEISRDDETYASGHDVTGDGNGYGGITIPSPPFKTVPIESDGEEFIAVRKLLTPAFSPKSAAAWEPYLRASAIRHINAVIERGEMDLVYDYAAPVPAKLTMRFLGLPEDDWDRYALPFHELMSEPGSEMHTNAIQAMVLFLTGLFEAIADRKATPREDYISYLTRCRVNGEPLADEMLGQIVFLVIAGGVDTTTSLTALGCEWLSEHPDVRKGLAAAPSRIPRAIEEFLRYFSPVQTNARTVTRDTELGGCPMAAMDRVLLPWAAANHDPDHFDRPEELDVDRWPNRHAAFGFGAHRCLGSNLGRLQLKVMFEELLRRVPDFATDRTRTQRYGSVGITNGLLTLPATFTPGIGEAVPDGAPPSTFPLFEG